MDVFEQIRTAQVSVYFCPENHQHAHSLISNSQTRPSTSIYTRLKMHFTSLFPIATSLALASAGIVSERQFEGDVAVLKVFDYNITNCAGDESTVDIGVGPMALDLCIPFSEGYWTVSYTYLESPEYSSKLEGHAGT